MNKYYNTLYTNIFWAENMIKEIWESEESRWRCISENMLHIGNGIDLFINGMSGVQTER